MIPIITIAALIRRCVPDGLRLTVLVLVQGDGKVPAFGRTRVEFGDGEETDWDGVVTERRIAHTYRQPGTYPIRVWFQHPARVSLSFTDRRLRSAQAIDLRIYPHGISQ